MKRIAIALLATLASTTTLADTAGETYIGGQFAQVTYDEDGFSEAEPTALIGRLGYFFADHFAMETRLGFGLGDDSIDANGYDIDLEVDSLIGFYGLGNLPLNDMFSVYALAGLTRGELTAEADGYGVSVTADDSGFSYGAGVQARFNHSVSAHVEYMSYLDESDYSVSGLAVGFNVHF